MAMITTSNIHPSWFLSDSNALESLSEEFFLCENKNMYFHWADFFETCDLIKAQIETNAQLMDDFKRRETNLSRLALIPVWIRTSDKIHQTTMYDLYERYLLNYSYLRGVDPFGPIEISFISGTGPFKSLAVSECFNKSTYHDFVLIYLLGGKLPRRDYRLRLKAKLLLEYGEDFQKAELVQLEQFTTQGLLLSVDSDFYTREISKETEIRFLMDTQLLHDISSKSLPEMQKHLAQYSFNLLYSARKEDGITCSLKDFSIQSSFDFLISKKVYLFISYNKLRTQNEAAVKNIQGFVQHSRELVRSHYRHLPTIKSA